MWTSPSRDAPAQVTNGDSLAFGRSAEPSRRRPFYRPHAQSLGKSDRDDGSAITFSVSLFGLFCNSLETLDIDRVFCATLLVFCCAFFDKPGRAGSWGGAIIGNFVHEHATCVWPCGFVRFDRWGARLALVCSATAKKAFPDRTAARALVGFDRGVSRLFWTFGQGAISWRSQSMQRSLTQLKKRGESLQLCRTAQKPNCCKLCERAKKKCARCRCWIPCIGTSGCWSLRWSTSIWA